MMGKGTISVCLISYNQGKYIHEALNSIYCQKDVSMEVIIADDFSTDNTFQLINDFVKSNALDWKILKSDRNLGMQLNWHRALNAATSEFVSILEGDDFWTDEFKLKKQIDFLTENKNYTFCFHPVNSIYEGVSAKQDDLVYFPALKACTFEDVVNKPWFIPTCSMVYRRSCMEKIPSWTLNLQAVDLPVQLVLSSKGSFGMIDQKMGTYRIHQGGISQFFWSKNKHKVFFSKIKIFEAFSTFEKSGFENIVNDKIFKLYKHILQHSPSYTKDYRSALVGYLSYYPGGFLAFLKDAIARNMPQFMYRSYQRFFKK